MIRFKTFAAMLLCTALCMPATVNAQTKRNVAKKRTVVKKKSPSTATKAAPTVKRTLSATSTSTNTSTTGGSSRNSTVNTVTSNSRTREYYSKNSAAEQGYRSEKNTNSEEMLHKHKGYVGGSIGYSSTAYDGNTTNSAITFAPEAGYAINDTWSIGVMLSYSSTTNSQSNTDLTNSYFTISPYVRYSFYDLGRLGFFCDGVVSISRNNIQTMMTENGETKATDNYRNGFGVALNPGISYRLSDRISLVAHLGRLSYTSNKPDKSEAKATTTFSLNLSNSISFGAFYNF